MSLLDPLESLSAGALIAEARAAQGAGKIDRSISLLNAWISLHPKDAQALNMLGLTFLRQGDGMQARDMLARAADVDPHAAPLWLNLAHAQRSLNDAEGERRSLIAALDRDPYLLIAHVRKAELHARLQEDAHAVEEWQAVLMLCSDGRVLSNATERLIEQAKAYIEPRAERMAEDVQRRLQIARTSLTEVETRRFDAAVDLATGKRRIFVSQSSGLHFPFLPADEFFPRAHFPWIEAIEAATGEIQAEFDGALSGDGQGFTPYVNQASGAATNVWSELSRSTRWSAYYLWRYGVRNESACAQCPATARALEALPRADQPHRAPTAFFSLLAPNTRIPPHTGVSNTRAIVHLPLLVPAGCGFRVGSETREWKIGEAFVFDDTIEHEAWNDSDKLRAVLIFDVWNPHLSPLERDLLRTFYASADLSGLSRDLASGL